jgi:hypothetical protein
MTSVTERPANAQPYCVASVPRLRVTPPAAANRMEGRWSCICSMESHSSFSFRDVFYLGNWSCICSTVRNTENCMGKSCDW